MEESLKEWVRKIKEDGSDEICVGYFGSYARGDWGVGSDLDLILILENTEKSFEKRGAGFDTTDLPVPTELFIYSRREWQKMKEEENSFYRTVTNEIIWIKQE